MDVLYGRLAVRTKSWSETVWFCGLLEISRSQIVGQWTMLTKNRIRFYTTCMFYRSIGLVEDTRLCDTFQDDHYANSNQYYKLPTNPGLLGMFSLFWVMKKSRSCKNTTYSAAFASLSEISFPRRCPVLLPFHVKQQNTLTYQELKIITGLALLSDTRVPTDSAVLQWRRIMCRYNQGFKISSGERDVSWTQCILYISCKNFQYKLVFACGLVRKTWNVIFSRVRNKQLEKCAC